MKRAVWVVAIVALLSGRGLAAGDDLSFTSSVDVNASCNEVWTTLTEFGRLGKLIPHLHGTANVPRATQIGDMLFYTIDKADKSKSTGKFVVTAFEPAFVGAHRSCFRAWRGEGHRSFRGAFARQLRGELLRRRSLGLGHVVQIVVQVQNSALTLPGVNCRVCRRGREEKH